MESNKRKRNEQTDGYIPSRRPSQNESLDRTFQRKKKLSIFGTTIILQLGRSMHVDDNLDEVVQDSIDAVSSHNPTLQSLIERIQSPQYRNNNNSNAQTDDDLAIQQTSDANTRFVELMLFIFNMIEQITVMDGIPQQQEVSSPMQPSDNTERPKKEKYKFKASNPSTMFEKHWRDHFQELAQFKNANGHCNVSRTTKGFEQLGNWLADQRRKLRRGKLTKEQYQMLTDLGVEWDRSYYFVARSVS